MVSNQIRILLFVIHQFIYLFTYFKPHPSEVLFLCFSNKMLLEIALIILIYNLMTLA